VKTLNNSGTLDFSVGYRTKAVDFARESALKELIRDSDDFYFWKGDDFFTDSNPLSHYRFHEPVDRYLEQFIVNLKRSIPLDNLNRFTFQQALTRLTSPHEPLRGMVEGVQIFDGPEKEFLKAFCANFQRAHYPLLGYLSDLYDESLEIIKSYEDFQRISDKSGEKHSVIWERSALVNAPVTYVTEAIASGIDTEEILSESMIHFERLLELIEKIQLSEKELLLCSYEPPDYSHQEIIESLRQACDELFIATHLEL